MSFPDTKYMGSKQSLLPFIMGHMAKLEFSSALDAFSGSGCVGYAMKQLGRRVIANDFMKVAYHTAKATIENNRVRLAEADLEFLLRPNPAAPRFITETFTGLYFPEADCTFLDEVCSRIGQLECEYKRSIALGALCRACMRKRPRGIFTFTGRKGWDERRDLKLSMRDQFVRAVAEINGAVVDNARRNRALCKDVFELSPRGVDLVYIDTPYLSPHSDADYTRRYHFLEGLCCYWQGVEIQHETETKKIRSYPTAFSSTRTAERAFHALFERFRECILVVSYSSNGVPSRDRMVEILKCHKGRVRVVETSHKYCHGNHGHRVGNNNNDVQEYLFIAM